jgi:hypothetical protein
VVDVEGLSHAILGRPCYAKFMAIPNYTDLKLKMMGSGGVIIVGSKTSHAHECNKENYELAKWVVAMSELHKLVHSSRSGRVHTRLHQSLHCGQLQTDRGLEDGVGRSQRPHQDC